MIVQIIVKLETAGIATHCRDDAVTGEDIFGACISLFITGNVRDLEDANLIELHGDGDNNGLQIWSNTCNPDGFNDTTFVGSEAEFNFIKNNICQEGSIPTYDAVTGTGIIQCVPTCDLNFEKHNDDVIRLCTDDANNTAYDALGNQLDFTDFDTDGNIISPIMTLQGHFKMFVN